MKPEWSGEERRNQKKANWSQPVARLSGRIAELERSNAERSLTEEEKVAKVAKSRRH